MLSNNQVRVIDPILSDFARGYENNELVGNLLFPRVDVGASGGQVIEFDKSAFQLYDTQRAPGSATKRIELGYLGRPYALESHALEALVPYENMRDASLVPGIDLARESLMSVVDSMALKLEFQQASLARNAALYPAANKIALLSNNNFSVPAFGVKAAVTASRAAIRAQTGKKANVMILPPNSIAKLDIHPEIRDRLKYTGGGNATAQMLATYFEVDTVVEGGAVYTTSSSASAAMIDVWGNDIVLAYVPKNFRSVRTPSFGYTYSMRGQPSVKTPYQDNNRESWVYGAKFERAPVIAAITSGYLIQNAFN